MRVDGLEGFSARGARYAAGRRLAKRAIEKALDRLAALGTE